MLLDYIWQCSGLTPSSELRNQCWWAWGPYEVKALEVMSISCKTIIQYNFNSGSQFGNFAQVEKCGVDLGTEETFKRNDNGSNISVCLSSGLCFLVISFVYLEVLMDSA